MDGDEVFVLIAAIVLTLATWVPWFNRVFGTFSPRCPRGWRIQIFVTPLIAVAALGFGVSRYADAEVRGNFGYILLFTAVGAVVLRGLVEWLALAGVEVVAEIIERGNRAAWPVGLGVALAAVALNIGANIGEGDTIYTTLGPLALASGLWVAFGTASAALTSLPTAIASGRDMHASVRFGALLLGASLPLAKAASGNWVSVDAVLRDFMEASVFLVALLVLAVWLEKRVAEQKDPLFGLALPSSLYLALAALALTHR